jgi:CubicO group peptidase (beta-lactamase class C family)
MKKLILIFLITTAALAQAPGEDRAMGWFRAFNSGSFEQMDAFIRENYTSEAQQRVTTDVRKQRFEQMRGDFGKLNPVNVSTTPQGLQIDAESEKGEHVTFRFAIDAAAPHLINGVGVQVGGGPGGAPGPALPPLSIAKDATREQIASTLDAYVRKLDNFSGVVLAAKDGNVLFESAYGLANRRWNIPNKVTTRFDVGSITKDYTKLAVAQLVQAGKLKLDALVITYLPDYPNKEWAQKATVAQLVDHSSGLGDIFTERFWQSNTMRLRTPKDFIEFFGNDPLQFEPGKGKKYSNYGYVVLGAVIEAASGESYYDYVQKHIFDAVPMRGTGFFEFRKPIPDVALGHTRRLPDGTESKDWMETRNEFARGIPAGLSFSSARDLFQFERALRGGKLVNEAGTRWWFGGDSNGADVRAGGHPGCNAGVASNGTWTVIVLANIDPPAAETLAEHVYNALSR